MSFPARRILIPDDMSEVSRGAWAWARRCAAADADLESLFVYDLPTAPISGMPPPALSAGTKKNILARMRRDRPDAAGWRVAEGDAASAILRRGRRADLIVAGTHGRTGLARLAFGSVAETLLRESSVPVLVAREGALKPVRTVLAPVNSQSYAYKGLLLGARAAAHFGAQLVVLNVRAAGDRGGNPLISLGALVKRLPADLREKVRPRMLLLVGDPIAVILAESRRHGLVAMTAHRKSLVGDFVLGTTIERVARHSTIPVLAAPSSGS